MAESEIQILITAVDNATKRIDEIEAKLSGAQKNMSKATENTTASFEKQISSLVAVGNVASSADRIMSSYQNLQIRLENATDRLANAQDRLSKAQRNYNKVLNDSKSSSDDVRDAQQELTTASRGLNIAQNNLTRTQNQVVGTYINMGVQGLTLIRSLPALTAGLFTTAGATRALGMAIKFATGPFLPIILAITAVTAAFMAYSKMTKNIEETEQSLVSAKGELEAAYIRQDELVAKLADTYGTLNQAAKEASSTVKDMFAVKTQDETEGELTLAKLKHDLLNKNLDEAQIANIEKRISEEEENQKLFESNREIANATIANEQAKVDSMTGVSTAANELIGLTSEEISAHVAEKWNEIFTTTALGIENTTKAEIAATDTLIKDLEAKIADISLKLSALEEKKKRIDAIGKEVKGGGGKTVGKGVKKFLGLDDFIIQPNGNIIETNPKDTIIGTKTPENLGGGRGITINIQSLVANDAQSVATTLQRLLLEKINI